MVLGKNCPIIICANTPRRATLAWLALLIMRQVDRTNREFGKTTTNIRMVSVIWNGMGIPLPWTLPGREREHA
jgi:hypothetical protein